MCENLLLIYEILKERIALHVAVYVVHLWDEGHSGTCNIIILSGLQARLLLSKIPMGKFLSKNSNSLINIRFISIISYKISSSCYVYRVCNYILSLIMVSLLALYTYTYNWCLLSCPLLFSLLPQASLA